MGEQGKRAGPPPVLSKGQSGETLESPTSVAGIGYAAEDYLEDPPDDVVKLLARFAPQADRIRRAGKLGFAAAVIQGEALLEVRAEAGHGQFRIWLAFAFRGWSERQAQQLMNLARWSKSEKFADLERLQNQINVSAFYLLAAPSMPPEVLDLIVDLAEHGRCINARAVREIAAALKPPGETNTVNERQRLALTGPKQRSNPRQRTSAEPESSLQPQDEPAKRRTTARWFDPISGRGGT